MNGREIIKKVIEFDSPPRIGMDFAPPYHRDIAWIFAARLASEKYDGFSQWGYHKSLLQKLSYDFYGEVRCDFFGNIYGRLEGKTKGESVKGALEDSWEDLDIYEMPKCDEKYEDELKSIMKEHEGKFMLGAMPVSVFSTIRDLRRLENVLVDLILEEEPVQKLLGKVAELAVDIIAKAAEYGFDGIIMYDDWGTQTALLINPTLWRRIFKPVYAKLAKEIHDRGMKFFIHSCGYVYDIVEDFIEIGVDVLNFDQPEVIGIDRLSKEFGGRVTFWSPVDIQKVMQTGSKELIQESAAKMISSFGGNRGGFIAKDYPSWDDVGVEEEWAQWAREVFAEKGIYY